MHNSWGSYPIFYKTLNLWSISSVFWGKASHFFLVLCAIMKLCWELGLFGTILSFGSLISFCGFQWISHSLMYLLMISSKWWFLHLVFFSLGISLYFGIGSWKSWACILASCSYFGMFSFFDPIYRGNSTKSQIGWDVHEIHFHIYMHIFMWSLSYVLLVLYLFGPNEFGYHFVCVVVLGTIGDALDTRLIQKEGVVTMCLLESS